METINIAVPESLQEFVQARVVEGGFGSASDYVRELISADQKKKLWAVLEAEVIKGIESGPSVEMTAEDWAELRKLAGERTEVQVH